MSIDNFIRNNRHLGFRPSKYFRAEGEEGIKNLARLAKGLGYEDPLNFGQFDGACYGDLICMLEDNSGLVEVMLEWLEDNFEDQLSEESDNDLEDAVEDSSDDDDDDDSDDEEDDDEDD
jgi:hypothetical protein